MRPPLNHRAHTPAQRDAMRKLATTRPKPIDEASAEKILADADAELARTGARKVKLGGFENIDVWYGHEDRRPWWERVLRWGWR